MPTAKGTKTTSDFLLEIAQKSKAEYRIGYEEEPFTTTMISNVCSVLNDFGYTEAYVGEYDMGKVLADLKTQDLYICVLARVCWLAMLGW